MDEVLSQSICVKYQQTTVWSIFVFFFSQEIGFNISCKSFGRQYAWNDNAYFLGKNKETIISLSSAELAQAVVKASRKHTYIVLTPLNPTFI